VKPRYKYMQHFYDDWCSTDTGVESFALWWFLSISPPKSTTTFTVRSCQPCTILWMAATMVTHSVCHSIHRWGSIYLAWYYQLWEFTFLRIHPHDVTERYLQHRFSVIVWYRVWSNNLIGPHVIKICLATTYYRNFLENELPLPLEEVPLAAQRRMWLQHDGAVLHFGRAVTEIFTEHYEGRWIGIGELVAWSTWSPVLNPLDFFLWVLHEVESVSRW
jgi:hypothetical protein